MITTRFTATLVLLVAVGGACAQQAATYPPCANVGGASAAARGCGPGGAGPHARWGADNTSGWSMMTPEERQAHQQHMAGMQNYPECQAYVTQHHEEMVARAKERGMAMPSQPRHDACASFPGKPSK